MKCSEFRRWLLSQGAVEVRKGKGSHLIFEYNGNQTSVPHHKGKEIGEGLRLKIIKELGL